MCVKLFALQTDIELLKQRFITPDETVLHTAHYHGFLFIVRSMRSFLFTLLILAAGGAAAYFGTPWRWVIGAAIVLWFVIAFFPMVSAYIDWKYDFLLITSEKIVAVIQGSVFRREIRQMNLDNIASVRAQTQMLNIFPFGILCIDLKEGMGQQYCLPYIRESALTASIITDAVTQFQRRKIRIQPKPGGQAAIVA